MSRKKQKEISGLKPHEVIERMCGNNAIIYYNIYFFNPLVLFFLRANRKQLEREGVFKKVQDGEWMNIMSITFEVEQSDFIAAS